MAGEQQNRALDQWMIQTFQTYKELGGGVRDFLGQDSWSSKMISDPNYRAQFYPAPGETYDAWVNRVDDHHPGFADMLGKDTSSKIGIVKDPHAQAREQFKMGLSRLQGDTKNSDPKFAEMRQRLAAINSGVNTVRQEFGFADPNNLGKTENVGGGEQPQFQDGSSIMRAFAERMMKPLDMNDPYVKNIVSGVQAGSSRNANNRGIGGGLAVRNSAALTGQAMTGLQQQRDQLGLQALGQAEGLDMSKAQMEEASYNNKYQAMLAASQRAAQQAQSTGQTIGAVGGGLIGSAFGAPMIGASIGAGIGGTIGGATAPAAPQYNYQSSYRGNGGGGLTGGGY